MKWVISLAVLFLILLPGIITGLSKNEYEPSLSSNQSVKKTYSNRSARATISDILINEFMADPEEDFNNDGSPNTDDEYIELFNPTLEAVNISRCILDDIEGAGSSPYEMVNMEILPLSYLIFFREDTGLVLNNNGEERVRLLSPDGEDIDNFTYTSTKNNRCWNRRGDGNETWTIPRLNTPGLPNPSIPRITINEFLSDPETESTDEWIELYNAGDDSINMTEWTISDMDSNIYQFPELVLKADDYAVLNIGSNSGKYQTSKARGFIELFMENPNQVLTDSGDDILLSDDIGVGVDYISYGNGSSVDGCPEPLAFHGTIDLLGEGVSMALLPNGRVTDYASEYTVMIEGNITKGWNNSLPQSIALPGLSGFDTSASGEAVNFTMRNNCNATSEWWVTDDLNRTDWNLQYDGNLDLEPFEKTRFSMTIEPESNVMSGENISFNLAFTSRLSSGIVFLTEIIATKNADLLINEIMIDPKGADSENDEWIEIINKGETAVSLADWKLFSDVSDIENIYEVEPIYVFPNCSLSPENVLLLHSTPYNESHFSDECSHLFINQSNIWTNTRGSAALISPSYSGKDMIRWGDGDLASVRPDIFIGSCPKPGSGYTLARKWYLEDTNEHTDYFIPPMENMTPGLPNKDIYSYLIDHPHELSIVEYDSHNRFDINVHNTGNRSAAYEISIEWEVLTIKNGTVKSGDAEGKWGLYLERFQENIDPGRSNSLFMNVLSPRNEIHTDIIPLGIKANFYIWPSEDPHRKEQKVFFFQLPLIDLHISDLIVEREKEIFDNENITQGEILEISLTLTNLGPVNSSGVSVNLYVDEISETTIADSKYYSSIPGTIYGGARHPKFSLDTLLYPGKRRFIVLLEPGIPVNDASLENNKVETVLNVTPLVRPEGENEIIITEIYYYSYLEDQEDEYVTIYNRGNRTFDISGWQLCSDPSSPIDKGLKFPSGTHIIPKNYITVAKNGYALDTTSRIKADFDTVGGIFEDMERAEIQWIDLKDYSGMVTLRTHERWVIDSVLYGNEELNRYGWSGEGVPRVSKGFMCRRNQYDGDYSDSNTSSDFNLLKQYSIGKYTGKISEPSEQCIEEMFSTAHHGPEKIEQMISESDEELLLMSEKLESASLFSWLQEALMENVDVRILLEGHPYGGISDEQRFITHELFLLGAEIYYLDDRYNDYGFRRFETLGANFLVVDGESAIIQSSPFTETGCSALEYHGVKGMGFLLDQNGASFMRELFFSTINSSCMDVNNYYQNHTHYGSPEPDYEFEPDEIRHTVQYDQDELKSFHGGFISIYPYSSHEASNATVIDVNHIITQGLDLNIMNRGIAQQEFDPLMAGIMDAEEKICILTERFSPVLDDNNINAKMQMVLPHLYALMAKAESGVEINILLDISQAELRFVEEANAPSESGYNILDEQMQPSGVMESATWINALANDLNIENLHIRFDYLDGAKGIEGTMIQSDGKSLALSSAGLVYEDLYLNMHWAGKVNLNGADEMDALWEYWWNNSIPLTRHNSRDIEEDDDLSEKVIITEVFYDSITSQRPDQYIRLHNPTDDDIDLSWWKITDKQSSNNGYEGTLVFPRNTLIKSGDDLLIAREGKAYWDLTTIEPNFEYQKDTLPNVQDLLAIKGIPILTNPGDDVFLLDEYHRIIDAAAYGISGYSGIGWNGPASPSVDRGCILRRTYQSGSFIDTNSSSDFMNIRPYRPGQSDFKTAGFDIEGNVTCFVSPDCSFPEMITALDSAKRSLYVNVYQFHNPHLLDKMVNMSLDGIIIKVLLEGGPVGGVTDYQKYVSNKLNDSGADVRYMISDRTEGIGARYDFNHAKYMIIDNRTVVVLSENFKISGIPLNSSYGNRGWGIAVDDPNLANYFSQVFFHDFNSAMKDIFSYEDKNEKYGEPPEDMDMNYHIRTGAYMKRFDAIKVKGNSSVKPVFSPDTSSLEEGPVIALIENAVRTIKIEQLDVDLHWRGDWTLNWSRPEDYYIQKTNEELVLNRYLTSTIDAARRGVKVKVLLDSAFVWGWSHSWDNGDTVWYLNKIAGMEGLDLEARLVALNGMSGRASLEKVHNKGIIVDGESVLVSSINWGGTSVLKNREAGLIVTNYEVAAYYERVFDFDWNLSIFNFVSPYILHSANRTLTPRGNTQTRISLCYLNNSLPSTLKFGLTTNGPIEVNLSHEDMRIYPGETRELILFIESSEDAIPGTPCGIKLSLTVDNSTQDFLFIELNITKMKKISAEKGNDSHWDTIMNILTVLLVAGLILIAAIARDYLLKSQDVRNGMNIKETKDGKEASDNENTVEEVEIKEGETRKNTKKNADNIFIATIEKEVDLIEEENQPDEV